MAMIFGPVTSLVSSTHLQDITIDDDFLELLLDTVWRSIGND
jgi:hypothetical protein